MQIFQTRGGIYYTFRNKAVLSPAGRRILPGGLFNFPHNVLGGRPIIIASAEIARLQQTGFAARDPGDLCVTHRARVELFA